MNVVEPVESPPVASVDSRGRADTNWIDPRTLATMGICILIAWVALAGALIAAGAVVTHSPAVTAWDRHVTEWVVAHRTPQLNATMKTITWLGTWIALAFGATTIVVLTAIRRLPIFAVALAIVAWGGETAGVTLAKNVVRRQRPPENIWLMTARGWSWPSGHTATAAVVFAVLAIVASYLGRRTAITFLAWGIALLAVAATGLSRIELGVHWTTDVIAGVVFVSLWIAVIAAVTAAQLHLSTRSRIGSPIDADDEPKHPRSTSRTIGTRQTARHHPNARRHQAHARLSPRWRGSHFGLAPPFTYSEDRHRRYDLHDRRRYADTICRAWLTADMRISSARRSGQD